MNYLENSRNELNNTTILAHILVLSPVPPERAFVKEVWKSSRAEVQIEVRVSVSSERTLEDFVTF